MLVKASRKNITSGFQFGGAPPLATTRER